MSKITGTKLGRLYEKTKNGLVKRDKPLPTGRLKTTLECEGHSFNIYVHTGQFINKKKLCKKLLKEKGIHTYGK